MMDKPKIYLVTMPEEIRPAPGAMCYAANRAREAKARVAILSIVQPAEIAAWGGVDKLMTDEAFDKARKVMAHYAAVVEEMSGTEPLALFRKGERREVILDVIENEPDLSALVLTAYTEGSERNNLIQYLTSDKGIKKLPVPLIVVPDTCFPDTKENENVHTD